MNKLKLFFTKNSGLKIMSFILAIFLWLIVINKEDPFTQKEFNNIEIQVLNQQIYMDRGKFVDFDENQKVTVAIKGRRKTLDKLKANKDVIAVADLKAISSIDTVPIEIKVNTNSKDSIEKLSSNPLYLNVNIENIVTIQKTVEVKMQGTPARDFVVGNIITKPNTVEIQGPESKIALVDKVQVAVDVNNKTDDILLYNVPYNILDSNGEEIKNLQTSRSNLDLRIPIYKTKVIPVKARFTGELPNGYQTTGTKVEPDTIKIKGRAEIIDEITELELPEIAIGNINTSFEQAFKTDQILSATFQDVTLYDQAPEIKVSMEVEKEAQETITIPIEDISLISLQKDKQVKFVTTDDIEFTVSGLKNDIDQKKDIISCIVSLRDVPVGTHEIEVRVNLPQSLKLVGDQPKVTLEIIEGEKETSNDSESSNETVDEANVAGNADEIESTETLEMTHTSDNILP